jgi:hypothetical protein
MLCLPQNSTDKQGIEPYTERHYRFGIHAFQQLSEQLILFSESCYALLFVSEDWKFRFCRSELRGATVYLYLMLASSECAADLIFHAESN